MMEEGTVPVALQVTDPTFAPQAEKVCVVFAAGTAGVAVAGVGKDSGLNSNAPRSTPPVFTDWLLGAPFASVVMRPGNCIPVPLFTQLPATEPLGTRFE